MGNDRHPDLGDPDASVLLNHTMAQMEAKRKEREHAEKYPLCTKLAAHHKTRLEVQDFLEEMHSKGYMLAEWVGPKNWEELVPANDFDKYWLEYLEIDPAKLETERRSMLDEQRALNERKKDK